MWKSDKLQNFLSKKKNISLLYIIVSICILLLAFWGCTPEKAKEDTASSLPDVPALTQVLETILSGIEGVDGVQVAVTYESGTETIPLADIDGESRTVVTLGSGSSETVVTAKEIMPRVRGVVVVAGGAENARVRENLLSAVQALTGAPVHSIAVFPAKEQN